MRVLCVLTLLWNAIEAVEVGDCETLHSKLEYEQREAPSDISAVIAIVTQKVNEELEGVVGVTVKYLGDDIHRKVGEHDVVAEVTQEKSDDLRSKCYLVRFKISDTDECSLPVGHEMRHACHSSATCINTAGGYYCTCENGGDSLSCCFRHGDAGCLNAKISAQCAAAFRCPKDVCPGNCATQHGGQCEPDNSTTNGYHCVCLPGLVGNGRRCRPGEGSFRQIWTRNANGASGVYFRGEEGNEVVHPAELCGCQKPRIDYCADAECGSNSVCINNLEGPECVCEEGFTEISGYGCVDDTLPVLKLQGPQTMVLPQCGAYTELGLDIQDTNAEHYERTLRIRYSRPLGVCIPTLGNFHVNYTVATNWTDPGFVMVQRQVKVADIDECALAETGALLLNGKEVRPDCGDCEAKCDFEHGAVCKNLVGTYECSCPKCSTGDGFVEGFVPRKDRAMPVGYKGGTGCRDSCPPYISLLGDNPVFLPVTAADPGPNGETDVSDSITVGMPFEDVVDEGLAQRLALEYPDVVWTRDSIQDKVKVFRVPHDAMDASENAAETKYRSIVFVSLSKDEQRVDNHRPKECPKCPGCPECPPPPSCPAPTPLPTSILSTSCPVPPDEPQPRKESHLDSWIETTAEDVISKAIQSAAAKALIDDLSPVLLQIVAVIGLAIVLFLLRRCIFLQRERSVEAVTGRLSTLEAESPDAVYRTFSPGSASRSGSRREPDLTPLRPDATLGRTSSSRRQST